MKVDNPQFNPHTGFVGCRECPLEGTPGEGASGVSLCLAFGTNCPTSDSYAAAVALAEREAK